MRISKKKALVAELQSANLKIAKLEEKLSNDRNKNRETIKERNKECRDLRKKNKALKASRASWKSKAVERNKALKTLKNKTLCLDFDLLNNNPARHHYSLLIITIAVLLRVKCNCSYRSIPMILELIFNILGNRAVELSELPCSNTVENWVQKSGYSELKNGVKEYEGKLTCLILDESIRVGREKLLVGLICKADKEFKEIVKNSTEETEETEEIGKTLNFEDTRVLILEGRTSWKSGDIEEVVSQSVVDNSLIISYIIADEGNNLKAAIKKIGCPHIPDISHAIANCLKREFSNLDSYKAFITDVKKYQAKLIMGKNSFLRPKKQRAKARFMNQESLVIWAEVILEKWDTFSDDVRELFKEMPNHKQIVERLREAMDLVKYIANVLINNGISSENITKILSRISKIEMDNSTNNSSNKSIGIVISELKKYLNNYKEILETKLTNHQNIFGCSKVVERLFGIYKEKVSTNYFNGVTASCLELPLVCLSKETLIQKMKFFIETVFMSNINDWKKQNQSDNQAIKRKELFKR